MFDSIQAGNFVETKALLLSKKISTEFAISCKDYPQEMDPIAIILDAYQKANDLFTPGSESSISISTLQFYLDHMEEAFEFFLESMDSFTALSSLLKATMKIHDLKAKGEEALKRKFSSELIDNRKYYKLFDVDYYLELSRTDGIEKALAELEEDVNIRANTYYNAAYNDYLDILPGFEAILKSATL